MSYATLPAASPAPPPLGPGTSPTGILVRRRGRTRSSVPPRLTTVIVVTVAALAVQAGAAVLLTPGGLAALAVRVEEGSAPGLAAGMLLTAMFLATGTRWAADGDARRARHLWTVLTAVAAYFAAAENTALHGRLGRILVDRVGPWLPERLHRGDVLRTVLYLLVLGLLALLLRRETARYRGVRPLLALAAATALAGTALGIAVRNPTVLTTLGVRALHDAAAVALALAVLAGLVAARTLQADRDNRPAPDRRLRLGPAITLVVGLVLTSVPAFVRSALPDLTIPHLPPAGHWPPLAAACGALVGAAIVLLGAVLATRTPAADTTDRDAAGRDAAGRDAATDHAAFERDTTARDDDYYGDFWVDRAAAGRSASRGEVTGR